MKMYHIYSRIRTSAAVLALCLTTTACQQTDEIPQDEMYPVEVAVTRAEFAPGESGEEGILTFGENDTFSIIAHNTAATSWNSGLYRFPKSDEIQTLRPVLSIDFASGIATDGPADNRGGLYLAPGTYELHLIHPAVEVLGKGFMAVPRDKSVWFSTDEQPLTFTSGNAYNPFTFLDTTHVKEVTSALTLRIRQRDEVTTAIVSDVRLVNAGDNVGQTHLHTLRTTLTFSEVNNDITLGTTSGTEGQWAATGKPVGKDTILYQTNKPIRIHCANYSDKSLQKGLAIKMKLIYRSEGVEDRNMGEITIPLSFLDALPSIQYNITLSTNPNSVYVTYTVSDFIGTVTQTGDIESPVYTVGELNLITGIWKGEYEFNNDI